MNRCNGTVVIYVAIIAIVNVCIGAALGCLLPPFARRSSNFDGRQSGEAQLHEGDSESDREAASIGDPRETRTAEETESIIDDKLNSANSTANDGRPDLRGTWSRYAEQLRDIRQRAQYCRSSQDKNLGRQIASQLQNCIENWYTELQRTLEAPDDAISAGFDMTTLEMFSAQVETSLSNTKAIDWSLKFEEVLGQLENEITLLHEQQRTVLPPAARARAANV